MSRLAAFALIAALCCAVGDARDSAEAPWPQITQAAKPWIRWWWPGNAVEPAQLTRELEAFARVGIGGVEITPIYGARGAEARAIDYLSPRWIDMLAHAMREARRLGLGVDMATGTGWPFGGPRVSAEDGSSAVQFVDGRLAGKPTEMRVKRAAPGGEGRVLDPYAPAAMRRYLEPFSQALASLPGAVRSQFHDSFEYFDSSWSPALPEKFRQLQGYDVQRYAAELAGTRPLDADTLGRVQGDYRRTLAAMHVEYLKTWVSWAHAHGSLARNQAHGAPGRLLDLYSLADIPETESFGATVLPIPGLRQAAEDIREDPDPPVALIGRFAASAAHVQGRPLASAESLTWLRENFRESPAAAKLQIDRLFVAGINHVFYHGATYSPAEAAWPGWFFYAATQLNPRNPLWRDFGALHDYVARTQSILQAGKPDNDVLFYWPEADEQDEVAGDLRTLMRQHGMHENQWLVQSPAGRRALELIEAGYALDFISDEQLREVRSVGRRLLTAAGTGYHLLVIPDTGRMPVETLAALVTLVKQDAPVVFEGLPEDVPGLGSLEERRAAFTRALDDRVFRQKRRLATDLVHDLEPLVRREASLSPLWYTRRTRGPEGRDYFVVNATPERISRWVTLNSPGAHVAILDPLTGDCGLAASESAGGQSRVYLQLDSGRSLILRLYATRPKLRAWRYLTATGTGRELTGRWRLEFVSGGPVLPGPVVLEHPTSWTRLPDPDAARFSGTARYRLAFDAPAVQADDWLLDLGDVRETARVTLNGRSLGTVWSLPATLRLGPLRARGNRLEIEVTNLPANRVRDLDLRKVDWKIMKDINLASLHYQALDASAWRPQPSGLLGPVRLVPLRALQGLAGTPR